MTDQTRGPNETLPPPGAEAQAPDENKLIAERRAKLAALRELGNAFPNDFRRDAYAGELQAKYATATAEELEAQGIAVAVAGRMLAKRVMGKASFANDFRSHWPHPAVPAGRRNCPMPTTPSRAGTWATPSPRWVRCSARVPASFP